MTMAICRPETLSRCASPLSRMAARSAPPIAVCPPVSSALATAPAGPGRAAVTRASIAGPQRGEGRRRRLARRSAPPPPARSRWPRARKTRRRAGSRSRRDRRRHRRPQQGADPELVARRRPGRVLGLQPDADAAARAAPRHPGAAAASVTRRPSGRRSTATTRPLTRVAVRGGSGGRRLPPGLPGGEGEAAKPGARPGPAASPPAAGAGRARGPAAVGVAQRRRPRPAVRPAGRNRPAHPHRGRRRARARGAAARPPDGSANGRSIGAAIRRSGMRACRTIGGLAGRGGN